MAKKENTIYAPGELGRVRDKLSVDNAEAKRMAEKLGGEIGYERSDDAEKTRFTRHERVNVKTGGHPGKIPKKRVELPSEEESDDGRKKSLRRKETDPSDDPSVQLKSSYWDRIKMDKIAGLSEFEIKSPSQVFYSMISLFTSIPDYVCTAFINRRMPEYYKKIEVLVTSTRTLLPRNNARRSEKMKKNAPLAYSILDVIRYWDLEKISADLSKIQANRKNTTVFDFAGILRAVYRPLFILSQLDSDAHIRGAYKILYKLLYIENPTEAQSKYQELIRTALTAFFGVSKDIHYLLYPLLMKSVSARYLPYGRFFNERKNRIMNFLNVTEDDQINPAEMTMQADAADTKSGENQDEEKSQQGEEKEEEISEEEKARRVAAEAERKAMDRGLQTLEILFPKAGWDRLSSYPDLYPYFVDIFDLKRGIVNIAPTDPMQQILILMRITEELFFGLRFVSIGTIPDSGSDLEKMDSALGEIINNWHYYLDMSFAKEYLPRMTEYIRILEGSAEERVSMYTKKLITELHWLKRLYFLPYYKFEALVPPPFQKGEINSIYVKIRNLRKFLTAIAAGIEQGNRVGGAESRAPCSGINNPWEPYVFEIPNPLSTRLDALLAPKARNNASLIFFCLAVVTVLDKLLNSEDSWAYSPRPGPLFRSVNGEGVMPLTGVDARVDANSLFKQALKTRGKNS